MARKSRARERCGLDSDGLSIGHEYAARQVGNETYTLKITRVFECLDVLQASLRSGYCTSEFHSSSDTPEPRPCSRAVSTIPSTYAIGGIETLSLELIYCLISSISPSKVT